jgi:hypothetical protein
MAARTNKTGFTEVLSFGNPVIFLREDPWLSGPRSKGFSFIEIDRKSEMSLSETKLPPFWKENTRSLIFYNTKIGLRKLFLTVFYLR